MKLKYKVPMTSLKKSIVDSVFNNQNPETAYKALELDSAMIYTILGVVAGILISTSARSAEKYTSQILNFCTKHKY